MAEVPILLNARTGHAKNDGEVRYFRIYRRTPVGDAGRID
jgi:hypothetical protein